MRYGHSGATLESSEHCKSLNIRAIQYFEFSRTFTIWKMGLKIAQNQCLENFNQI